MLEERHGPLEPVAHAQPHFRHVERLVQVLEAGVAQRVDRVACASYLVGLGVHDVAVALHQLQAVPLDDSRQRAREGGGSFAHGPQDTHVLYLSALQGGERDD